MSVANSQFRVEDASTFKVVNRYTIVWLAIMYFDYLSTLDSEVLHVWTSKRPSLYQTLFLLNRYGTLVLVTFAAALTLMSVPLPICKRVMWISPLSGVFVVLVCDTIMSLRIDALYGKNRFIRWLLVVAITSELTVMIFMSTRLDALTLPPFVSVLTGFKGCTVTAKHVENAGIITALFWGSPLVVATLFFALTLYRSIDAMRGATRMRLYERFLTGQLKYFVVVAATHVVNVVLITQRNQPTIQSFNVTASIVLTSVSCSRLVLGLYAPDATTAESSPSPRSFVNPSALALADGNEPRTKAGRPDAERIELQARRSAPVFP